MLLIGRFASGMNGLLGAWLMFAPLATGDISRHSPDVWASLALGGILMSLGVTRVLRPEGSPALSWINLSLGACILVAPWLLRFAADEARMWAAVALGGTVMVLATLSAKMTLLVRQRFSRV